MSAVSGTRRAIKELADGTIRVQIDIDPAHRRQFFELFPEIDKPVALAPLVSDFERQELVEERPNKGGELAKLAGRLCADPAFQKWIATYYGDEWAKQEHAGGDPDDVAAGVVRALCQVESRAELDHNEAAAAKFHARIRKPWMEAQR